MKTVIVYEADGTKREYKSDASKGFYIKTKEMSIDEKQARRMRKSLQHLENNQNLRGLKWTPKQLKRIWKLDEYK